MGGSQTDPDDRKQRDETDKLQRAFFVACGRAMKRPLVVAHQSSTYPLVSDFDPNHWSTA